MSKNPQQKGKILYLLKILLSETDEECYLSMPQIISRLEALGISAERKSVYSDLELLRVMGYDVIYQKGKNGGYYIGERNFQLAELKLLVDSVQSSKFITEKKSDELIRKLEGLTSKNNARQLRRQVYIHDSSKSINEKIYYVVDKLHQAVTSGRKAAFKYFEYGTDKKRHMRNDGKDYIISPLSLTFSDGFYYVVAYYAKYSKISNFRVDRMADVRILPEKSGDINLMTGEKFSLTQYNKKTFGMYAGENKRLQILCDNSVVNHVIDRFGENVPLRKKDENSFMISVNVNVGPTFFAWLFTFGSAMKIIFPHDVAKSYRDMAENAAKQYQI